MKTILHTIETFATPGAARRHLAGIAAAAQSSLGAFTTNASVSVWVGHPVPKGASVPPIEDRLGDNAQLALVRADFDGSGHAAEALERAADGLSAALTEGGWQGSCWILDRMSAVGTDRTGAPADWLQVVMMTVKAEDEDEFNDWYDNEHVDRISRVSGFRGVERFKAVRGDPAYVALWAMPSAEESETPDWLEASQTPWTTRMRASIVARRRFVMTRQTGMAN